MLFRTDEIPDPLGPSPDEGADKPTRLATLYAQAPARAHNLLGRISDTVADVLPTIEHGVTYHFATAGLWSSHDLLLHLLGMTGPARVWIATWSITEEPVRLLIQALDEGLITELKALLDVRVRVRNPKVLAFAKYNWAQVAETVCHAKVTVLENDTWSIAIVGSANYTNNPRIEAGCIVVCSGAARFHRDWIEKALASARPIEGAFSDNPHEPEQSTNRP